MDVPIAVAGIQGVLRFNVLEDNFMATPPLLPISFLETIGANIDLVKDEMSTPQGGKAPMTRLPSGHRTVDIMQFDNWKLPEHFRHRGHDPFQLQPPTTILGGKDATEAESTTWTCAAVAPDAPSASTTRTTSMTSAMDATSASMTRTTSMTSAMAATPVSMTTTATPSARTTSLPSSSRRLSTVIEDEEEMSGIYVTIKNGSEIETMAKEYRLAGRWSMMDMEKFLKCLEVRARGRDRNLMRLKPNQVENSFSMILGRYVYGGFDGITNNSTRYPETCAYLNAWMKQRCPGLKFTSLCVNYDLRAPMHRDVNNAGHFPSVTVSFGQYSGGQLWVQKGGVDGSSPEPRAAWRKSPLGGKLAGNLFETYHNPTWFRPKCWHRVEKYQGQRISLTAYMIRGVDGASAEHKQSVTSMGFPLPSCDASVPECQHVLLEEESISGTSHANASQCEFDMESVFERGRAHQERTSSMATFRLERMMQRVAQFFLNSNRRPSRVPRDHVFASSACREDGGSRPEGDSRAPPDQEDGNGEDGGGLEATHQPHPGDAADYEAAVDGGADDAERRPPRREADIVYDHQAIESQEPSREHQSDHQRPADPFKASQNLLQGARGLQPPGGQVEVQSQCEEAVVDVCSMRVSLGPERSCALVVLHEASFTTAVPKVFPDVRVGRGIGGDVDGLVLLILSVFKVQGIIFGF